MLPVRILTFPIVPVPKPRMTSGRGTQHTPAAERYWAFKDEVRLRKLSLIPGDGVTFILPMPKSWSKRKKLAICGEPHMNKPDISNLLKALEDAIYEDDSGLWWYRGMMKVWGLEGRIVISRAEQGEGSFGFSRTTVF